MGNEESRISSSPPRQAVLPGTTAHHHRRPIIVDQIPAQLSWSPITHLSTRLWIKHRADSLNFKVQSITCWNSTQSPGACVVHGSGECSTNFCVHSQTLIQFKAPSRRRRPSSNVTTPTTTNTAAAAATSAGTGTVHNCSSFSFSPSALFPPLKKRCKFTKMADHFEYNHIPAHLSSIQNFHVKSILCHRGSLVIVHLSGCNTSVFGVVNLMQNKFLGQFGRQRVNYDSDCVEGEISPDDNYCLLRLPASSSSSSLRSSPPPVAGAAAAAAAVFQLYDLHTLQLVSQMCLASHPCSLFAFDPRFNYNRVVISDSWSGGAEAVPDSTALPSNVLRELPPVNNAAAPTPPQRRWAEGNANAQLIMPAVQQQQQQQQRLRLSDGRSFTLWNCVSWQSLASQMHPIQTRHSPRITNQRALCRLRYTPSGHLLVAVYVDDQNCRCHTIETHLSTSAWLPRRSTHLPNHYYGGSHHGNHGPLTSSSSPALCSSTSSTQSAAAAAAAACKMSSLPVFQSISGGSGRTVSACNASATQPANQPSWLVGCRLVILDSDQLLRLRMLEYNRMACPLHSCVINFSPQFSHCGSRLAVVHNSLQLGERVIVYSMQPPKSLKAIARQTIWQFLNREQIQRLQLPVDLVDFLLYRPPFSCAGSCISCSSTYSLNGV